MNPDGSNLTQISELGEFSSEGQVTWSPDGNQVAFIAQLEDTDNDGFVDSNRAVPALFVVNVDGSERQRLLGDERKLDCLDW